jgi:predicted DNA-binding transcriptional regulator YafY
MNRLDRALALLLLLRDGRVWSAADLARRLEVSRRTVYRDMETLSAIGVPVYAEMGRAGGFRLLRGYFLPPVMFSADEAVSLLLAVTLLRSLRARPFAAELETGERKLLAAMPDALRAVLADARKVIGFEGAPGDIFHPERPDPTPVGAADDAAAARPAEDQVVSVFLRAVLDRGAADLQYRSPYRAATERLIVVPYGVFWDRDRWYLVGGAAGTAGDAKLRPAGAAGGVRLWRADRVLAIEPRALPAAPRPDFDVRGLLGRAWLRDAMARWREEGRVAIRLTRPQAARLAQDWYYRHAGFEDLPDGRVLMTFGEDDRDVVLELLRWLGPGAELLEPREWRAALKPELRQMLAGYGVAA